MAGPARVRSTTRDPLFLTILLSGSFLLSHYAEGFEKAPAVACLIAMVSFLGIQLPSLAYTTIAAYLLSVVYKSPERYLALLGGPASLTFWGLFVFRYLRLVVHLISFWAFYRPTPIPANPTILPRDCTIILPTIDPENVDFAECIQSCLASNPGEIIVVTVGRNMAALTNQVVGPYRTAYPQTNIQVHFTNVANKRIQVAHGVRLAQGKITVLLDDHVFWPSSNFLPTILAPFENPKVGAVGTNKRVRRTDTGFNMRSFWNMIGALYLERHNFEIRATNAIDGGVFVISGRTAAYRTSILQSPGFLDDFTNEKFFFGKFGPLNADDDNFLTRRVVTMGYDIKIQYSKDAMIETTLGTYPKFLSQCLRWVRTTWRSNSASLFTDRTVWRRQPWCVYAVYLTSFVNFALFYDGALIYMLYTSAGPSAVKNLIAWIFVTKMVKLTPYFLREPQDLLMLPGYLAFAYFHSLIKLYAGLSFWVTAWGGRNLDAINQGNTHGGDDNDSDGSDSYQPSHLSSGSHTSRPASNASSLTPRGGARSSNAGSPPKTSTPWGPVSGNSNLAAIPANALDSQLVYPGFSRRGPVRVSQAVASGSFSPYRDPNSAGLSSGAPTPQTQGSIVAQPGSPIYTSASASVPVLAPTPNPPRPSSTTNTNTNPNIFAMTGITYTSPSAVSSAFLQPRFQFPSYSTPVKPAPAPVGCAQCDAYADPWVRAKQCQRLHSDGEKIFKTRSGRCEVEGLFGSRY